MEGETSSNQLFPCIIRPNEVRFKHSFVSEKRSAGILKREMKENHTGFFGTLVPPCVSMKVLELFHQIPPGIYIFNLNNVH